MHSHWRLDKQFDASQARGVRAPVAWLLPHVCDLPSLRAGAAAEGLEWTLQEALLREYPPPPPDAATRAGDASPRAEEDAPPGFGRSCAASEELAKAR